MADSVEFERWRAENVMKSLSQAELTSNYLSGVAAVEEIAESIHGDDWNGPGCGEWTAVETVRHLVAVVGWYEEWLERALQGMSDRPFDEVDFDRRNAEAITNLKHLDGPVATAAFSLGARSYLDRATNHLDVPFGYPAGTVTVGLHLGVAAAEWHLHAWDLSNGRGAPHEPNDPIALFIGAGACVAAAKGGASGRLLGLIIPLAAKRSPWKTMLKEAGRSWALPR